MDELLDYLKQQPKEILLWLFLELLKDEKITFHELAEEHAKYLQTLKMGETEKLQTLRSDVINLWVGRKKDIPSSLVRIITNGMNEGWVNITEEQIKNSKWNK